MLRDSQQTRHDVIMQLLSDGREHHIDEMAARAGASLPTLRRDLAALSDANLIVRTHGGARLRETGFKPTYTEQMNLRKAEKQAIAREAVALIRNHETIALCNGTTTYYLAQEIAASGLEVTIITNALDAAFMLAGSRTVRTILVGGEVTASYALSGHWSEPVFKKVPRIDKAFLGADGISATHGLTAYHPHDAPMHAEMTALAQEVIVLVDHTKFGLVRLSQTLALSELHQVITDSGLAPEIAAEFRSAGTNLRLAPVQR